MIQIKWAHAIVGHVAELYINFWPLPQISIIKIIFYNVPGRPC